MDNAELTRLINVVWLLLSAALVFLMQAGFLTLETGLTRKKNNTNVAAKNLTDISVAIALYWLFGFGLMFGQTGGGLGFFGVSRFSPDLMSNLGSIQTLEFSAFFLYQVMFCGTAVTIISGATAERMRFESYLLISAVISGLIYPVFGHWAWGGLDTKSITGLTGWLGSRGFVDFAGGTVVHSIGGWAALAVLILIKARAGRFNPDGSPNQIPKANLPLATLGTIILWFGWFGFNGGSAVFSNNSVALIIVNTLVAGASGMIAVIPVRVLLTNGIVEVDYIINGVLSGLVAITAVCHAVTPQQAFIIGIIGAWVMLMFDVMLLMFRIDDAVGAVPVHLGAGIWGTMAVAIFGNPVILDTGLSMTQQLAIQGIGVLAAATWGFLVPLTIFNTINLMFPLRVTLDEEEVGLNVSEQGAEPDYSEFPGLEPILKRTT